MGGGRTAAEKTLVEVLRLRWRKIWDCADERSGTALAKVLTNTTDAKTDNILREKRRAGPYTPLQDVCLGGDFCRNYTTDMQLVTPRAVAMAVRIEMAV